MDLCPLSFMKHPSTYNLEEGTEGEEEDIKEGREKRTNVLDVNKKLSQQIVRPYISYAEALGDLPTDLNKALVHWGLSFHGHKTKLLCCFVTFLLLAQQTLYLYYDPVHQNCHKSLISNGWHKQQVNFPRPVLCTFSALHKLAYQIPSTKPVLNIIHTCPAPVIS